MEMREVPKGGKPVEWTVRFSSYIPFQAEDSEWKVYEKIEAVSEKWKSVEFEDAWWRERKGANITNASDSVTTYIPKTFAIPNLED